MEEVPIKRDKGGRFTKGTGSPAGFKQHPENRNNNGPWRKQDSPRYWIEEMMKKSTSELEAIAHDEESSAFKKKIARCMLDAEWKEIREMIEEVYGKVPQTTINLDADEETQEEAQKFIKGFIFV